MWCCLPPKRRRAKQSVWNDSYHSKRMIVAVGNESRGLSLHTIKQAACRFTIPLSRHIDSLDVAATAAIALHYLRKIDAED